MTEVTPKKVLIVEDEDDLRFTLARAVSVLPGLQVLEAENFTKAREILQKHDDLDIVISDIKLPDGNGLCLLKEVRAGGSLLPFIIITGYHESAAVIESYRLGALRYLAKPFDLNTFLSAVNETLQWSQLVYSMDEVFSTPMGGWIEITSRARYEASDRMRAFMSALVSLDLEEKERCDLQLAIEELVQNAIEWGDKEDPSKFVHVAYALFSDRILIMVKDEGEGFILEDVPDPTVDPFEHLKNRLAAGKRAGGYGIHLTRHLVDDIIYNTDGNSVIITKYIKGKSNR